MIESKLLVDLWNFKFLRMYWKCWNDSGKEYIINSKDDESDVYIKKVLDDIDIPFFDKTRYL